METYGVSFDGFQPSVSLYACIFQGNHDVLACGKRIYSLEKDKKN